MHRHSVLWVLRDTADAEQRDRMFKGIAWVRFECPSIIAGDYGTDIFGGADPMRQIVPYKRRPRWRSAVEGPPFNYDVVMHLDFDNLPAYEAYRAHAGHINIAAFNDKVAENDLTARVEWEYDASIPSFRRGHVRHTAMFIWSDNASEKQKQAALDTVRRLGDVRGVESLAVGRGITLHRTSDFDWIMDVQLTNPDATKAFLESKAYREVMQAVAPVTRFEWTARASHIMRGV